MEKTLRVSRFKGFLIASRRTFDTCVGSDNATQGSDNSICLIRVFVVQNAFITSEIGNRIEIIGSVGLNRGSDLVRR